MVLGGYSRRDSLQEALEGEAEEAGATAFAGAGTVADAVVTTIRTTS